MSIRAKNVFPALKHGAYSKAALLPGESPAGFEELHRGLIADLTPNGRMEEETVAAIARLMWRKQNLPNFAIGQISNLVVENLRKAVAKESQAHSKQDDELLSEFRKVMEANKRFQGAKGTLKDEAAVEFLEVTKAATLDRLLKELDIEERLDAMIDRCLKRLLFLRGLKSISTAPSAPPQRLRGPSRAA